MENCARNAKASRHMPFLKFAVYQDAIGNAASILFKINLKFKMHYNGPKITKNIPECDITNM